MVYAAKRVGLGAETKKKKQPLTNLKRYPELLFPGEKVQIDVKEVHMTVCMENCAETESVYTSGQP